jgi:NADPH:quinone reductase-like Zn-dependent oxidoreductase
MENSWMASDFDGAFAEFVNVPASEVFPVECGWSDAQLATIPCAYGSAENMLHSASLCAGERVLVTGASGGVGAAGVTFHRAPSAARSSISTCVTSISRT